MRGRNFAIQKPNVISQKHSLVTETNQNTQAPLQNIPLSQHSSEKLKNHTYHINPSQEFRAYSNLSTRVYQETTRKTGHQDQTIDTESQTTTTSTKTNRLLPVPINGSKLTPHKSGDTINNVNIKNGK